MSEDHEAPPLVIYDGVCNLCNGSVNFILNRDPNAVFRFTPMQSEYARTQLKKYGIDPNDLDTIILITQRRLFVRSAAALEIARHLSGVWYLFTVFKLVPAPLRDVFYRIIARNRYRWFGRRETCLVPSDDVQSRFLF